MCIQEMNIKNRVCNHHFSNLVKAKMFEDTRNILISEKNYKGLTIYFTRYIHSISIKMLSLHDHESMRKMKESEE